jgi:hypothetical protein
MIEEVISVGDWPGIIVRAEKTACGGIKVCVRFRYPDGRPTSFVCSCNCNGRIKAIVCPDGTTCSCKCRHDHPEAKCIREGEQEAEGGDVSA